MDAFVAGALDFFQFLISLPKQGYTNLTRNSVEMWDGMTPLKYIRLVAIVGAYLFLRPYLRKWGERTEAKQLAKVASEGEGEKAKISPNALRDGGKEKSVSFRVDGEEEDGSANGAEWGKKARKRQQKIVEKVMEKAEEVKDDKDILELLVDYEEGEDGW